MKDPMKHTLEMFILNKRTVNGDYSVQKGDGERSMGYIAVICFEGDEGEYCKWLNSNTEGLGSLTPLQLLSSDCEEDKVSVKHELMMLLLRKRKILVPKMKPTMHFKTQMVNGFSMTVPVNGS